MSKGLEALKDIKETLGVIWVDSRFDTIEKELKQKEKLERDYELLKKQYDELLFTANDLNNENIELLRHKKALENIKPFLKNICLEENEKGEYEILIDVINSDISLVIARFKSKETYDLLKEVLCND